MPEHGSGAPTVPSSPLAPPIKKRYRPSSRSSFGHTRSQSNHPLESASSFTAERPLPLYQRRSEGDILAAAEAIATAATPDVEARLNATRRLLPSGGMTPPRDPVDLTTGQCMCCDSTIRWPAQLKQFRCTVCMTVNDLKPAKPAPPETLSEQPTVLRVERLREILDSALEGFVESLGTGASSSYQVNFSGAMHDQSLGHVGQHRPSARDSTDDPAAPPSRPPPPPPDNETCIEKLLPAISLEKPDTPNPITQQYTALASKMFRPLEQYIQSGFSNLDCLNASFVLKNDKASEIVREKTQRHMPRKSVDETVRIPVTEMPGEKEALMLMVGRAVRRDRATSRAEMSREKGHERQTSFRAVPGIDWDAAREFYELLLSPTRGELAAVGKLRGNQANSIKPTEPSLLDQDIRKHDVAQIEIALNEARIHLIKTLLRTTETLLKRPGRPLKNAEDIRFLLVILANPLFAPGSVRLNTQRVPPVDALPSRIAPRAPPRTQPRKSTPVRQHTIGSGPGSHSGIVKRLFGLLSNLSNECHHFLVAWFSLMAEKHFRTLVEVCGSFTTYRISRHDGKQVPRGAMRGRLPYADDWQVKSAARIMSLLDKANNNTLARRKLQRSVPGDQIVPSSCFYNMKLDYCDMIADFEAWESRSANFCFCQYPFYLSMGAKTQIMEHDARRQMELQARNAFYTNISARTTLSQYMVLKVRRDCLVEDSLKGISESVGTVEDIKKGLKVEFVGEAGIDAGGLKKEWFLMVAREVFDPNHGLFVYDDDASSCYFNPYSLESSEEFYLVGVLFGLAIYNSTILDAALPSYVFRKLIHFAPQHSSNKNGSDPRSRLPFRRSLEDLAEVRPTLAKGLQQLLDFEGNVEETFCRDFVVETKRYGESVIQPLCPGGEKRPVTNQNRKEFVELYVKHVLDTSVTRQFEPFKRGFYMVCGGNALSLFGPEEIELLVRGSAEPLDVQALKAVAVYDGWGLKVPAEADPAVRWFWNYFEKISPEDQRKLLSFITGSDRIPATGAANLTIKVVCLGQDSDHFPIARTCFNQICLYRYRKREKLERMLQRAVAESEGFGLK